MKKWIILIILLAVLMFVVAPWFGVSGAYNMLGFAVPLSLLLAGTVLFALEFFGKKLIPFKLKKKWSGIAALVLGFLFFSGMGWLPSILPTGAVTGAAVAPTEDLVGVEPATCAASVGTELRGKDAELVLNAWDLESNTPYTSGVDITTCYVYTNGITAKDFLNTTVDTTGFAVPNVQVGDVAYVYCGGTTYYSSPVEGLCIDGQNKKASIDAHTIVSETDLAITGYDDTGSAALSTGVNGTDYYMTIGANGEESMYLKLKVNVANKAYQFCGWATFMYYNISSVEPQTEEGIYTKAPTPEHLSSQTVQVNSTSTAETFTGDYVLYAIKEPILMSEWDSIKEQFVVETGSNDPVGGTQIDHLVSPTAGTATKVNGFAVLTKDCAYSRGGDGKIYFDAYTHDTSESDTGLDETETNPAGKTSGVVIAVR